ncbi:glycerol-3-phosphate dehydrogenase/oxidase [Kozakia baliensis]|uniref:Glycerol-3-phosphate dehydrogenase n=1 Tax=Kozakia baliensis TaxID=153496 RepID=A0A1D8UU71_9PROT|nr:glycerol-3-phosphate dehydrogenase/oxidase [Kozakia baliensis]AOX17194.1 glycerol-3-phosphate dehydrogenase [Kozakia baliensis]GBR32345.1 glycerol-3-phosphate dehydrogenase [Kozakia baliensis NRIC 0488]GEL64517.1 glycerol-3-phosphate dehydrogenase [Kozakia baliensis]
MNIGAATRFDGDYFDVVIIGGGINGVGLFRELALQQLKVLLIEREDICAGASAAPSRLIHGGIKYLETGEFRLVAQSTLERNLLLRNAPHVVHPLATVLPIHSWFGGIGPSLKRFLGREGKMTDRGVLVIELGLQIYDFLGRRARVMPRHKMFLRRKTRRQWPAMAKNVVATGQYYDAAISQPERLGYECVMDGLSASLDCAALTYTAPEEFKDGTLSFRDRETGATQHVKAGVVVNAGGAWIDRVNETLGLETRYIGGTKGSHLILKHTKLLRALCGKMVYFGTPDGRICLAYPFFDHVLVGSTDIRIENPDEAVCTDEEQEYMLKMLGDLFPSFAFSAKDVIYRYSGVRPLPASNAKNPGAISRDHIIHTDRVGETPVLSLVGGKWTTFRGLGEEVADRILNILKRKRLASTHNRAIGGGRDYPSRQETAPYLARLAAHYELTPERSKDLLRRYGTLAKEIAAFCAEEEDSALKSLPSYTRRELQFIAENELVRHLSDILFRRTTIAVCGKLTPDVVKEAGDAVASSLQWSREETAQECAAAWREGVERHHLQGEWKPDFSLSVS